MFDPADGAEFEPSGLATCRVCGCSDFDPCPGGRLWVPDPFMLGDLCSQCVDE